MKKLLYFSPMPPQKSGISDYSESLVASLAEHFEITIAVEPIRINNVGLYSVDEKGLFKHYRPDLYAKFNIKQVGWDAINFDEYDYRIYNLGNNPYYHSYMYDFVRNNPGLVIIHDYVLFYLVVGRYYGESSAKFVYKMFKNGGFKVLMLLVWLAVRRRHPLHCPHDRVLPLNREILTSKNKFMVHSQYIKEKILKDYPNLSNKVHTVNMISDPQSEIDKISGESKRKELGYKDDEILITSFGYIAETKLNHVVCQVVRDLQKDYTKIRYLMVGEGAYVDHLIDGKVIRKTGFVDLKDFVGFIKASDLVINLRNPSMGETSAAVIRILREGKPCVVSDDAWFSELPDESVVKISNQNVDENLKNKIIDFIKNPEKFQKIGEQGQRLIEKDYSAKSIALRIKSILTSESQ